jgi:hypothetical protein
VIHLNIFSLSHKLVTWCCQYVLSVARWNNLLCLACAIKYSHTAAQEGKVSAHSEAGAVVETTQVLLRIHLTEDSSCCGFDPVYRYCECFAAGIYCVSSCACQECFNKPEFEETVLNTRQQIESRNPLAFAPKIVQAAKASPRIGVGCFVMSLHILKPWSLVASVIVCASLAIYLFIKFIRCWCRWWVL